MILVIGGTGTIGTQLVRALSKYPVEITVLARTGAGASELPDDIPTAEGDIRDVDFMRGLLARTRTIFILNPVVGDELTRALVTLNLAADAGIQRIVYFSMLEADTFTDVPHAAAKYAAERMIAERGLAASILRAGALFQNDVVLKQALLEGGAYAMPIGQVGVSMVDVRDIADVAARELVRREQAATPLRAETIEIVGPEALTGDAIARIWSEVLRRPIRYTGDIVAFEKMARAHMPDDIAYDTALMFRRIHQGGYRGAPGAAEQLASRLGRKLRTYRAFAEELRDRWLAPPERRADAHAGA